MRGDLLLVAPASARASAIASRLSRDGFRVVGLTDANGDHTPPIATTRVGDVAEADIDAALAAHVGPVQPCALVYVPAVPAVAALDDTPAEAFVAATDHALVGAEACVRYLTRARASGVNARVVLVSGWAAVGLPAASAAAAISGALLGLARSWALELGPDGMTVNAVVAGAGVEGSRWSHAVPAIGRHPRDDDVAHAISFLVDERSTAINGQVLFVCGGLTPGIMPV